MMYEPLARLSNLYVLSEQLSGAALSLRCCPAGYFIATRTRISSMRGAAVGGGREDGLRGDAVCRWGRVGATGGGVPVARVLLVLYTSIQINYTYVN